VVAGRDDAVALQDQQRFAHGDAADVEDAADLVEVDAVPGSETAGAELLEHVATAPLVFVRTIR
jgi:hypothetical protein